MGGGAATPRSLSLSSSSSSSSSSIDSISNTHLFPSSVSSSSSSSSLVSLPRNTKRSGLSTDLRLGPSVSTPTPSDQSFDWPPIKPLLRSTLTGKTENQTQPTNLFVKVYMEGISIGRKLDLFAHYGYDSLVTALGHMFKTTIFCSDPHGGAADHSGRHHILTYEDKEGDWMMVGDVPWEIFLTSVKRLKITRADRC